MDFIAIDFETATSKNYSACSIGLVFVKDSQIIKEEYYLINPPDNEFDSTNTKIHGIESRDVVNSPNFKEVWQEIWEYFNDDIYIVAHNAPFDINVLKNSLLYYNLNVPTFYYFDSITFSNKACVNIRRSLAERVKHFGIPLENAHNALDDARAVAHLVIKCMKTNNIGKLDRYLNIYNVKVHNFQDFNHFEDFIKRSEIKKSFASKSLKDIEVTEKYFDANHPLFGKHIVFTGDLETMDRREAAQFAANLGAVIKNGVTRKTAFLVIGVQDSKIVGEEGLSGKERKANALIEKGFSIQLLNEEQYIRLLNYEVSENLKQIVES